MSSARSNTILKYGLYLIILLPLALTPFTFFPWHFGKTMIFQIIVEVLAVMYLVGGQFVPSFRRRGLRGGFNWLDWSILIFLAVITLTAFTGVNPTNSFWGNQARANGVFTWWHFGAFYFLLKKFFLGSFGAASSVSEEASRNSPPIRGGLGGGLLTIAVLVAILASLTSLFPQILPVSWQAGSGGGIIGNRAFLASYLILAIGISLYLFVDYKNEKRDGQSVPSLRRRGLRGGQWRWLFLAASVLFIYTIIDTGNRGALLGIMAGIFLGLALCLFLVRDKRIKIWSAVSLFALCFLLFALFFSRQSLFLQRNFPAIASLANISLSSGTSETRLMAWESAWQGIKARPVQGWGWGNYGVVFDKYYNPQFLKHSFAETVWDKPHNWLLEIGVTAGILGMVGYLGIFVCAFYYLLKKNIVVVETQNFASLRCGKIILSAALLAYFIAGLFLFETTNSLILWFAVLAMVSSSVVGVETQNFASLQSQTQTRIFNIKYLIFFVFFLVLCYFYYLPSLKSSYYMRLAERETALMDWKEDAIMALSFKTPFKAENAVFLAEQLTKFDKAGLPRLRSAEAGAVVKEKIVEDAALKITGVLERALSKYPDNLSYPVWAGQVYLVLGEKMDEKYFTEAERVLLAAEKVSPRKQEVLFLLGRLYLLKKDFDQALSFQKKAMAAAPEINTSHWFLGLTYVAQGERAKGLAEIDKAMKLGYNLTKDQKLYVLDLYGLEKDYAKLIEEYKKLIEAEPENVNWYVKLAAVYAEAGDKKAALEITRQVINLYPPIKAEAEEFIKKHQLEK